MNKQLYVRVKLLQGYKKILIYKVPPEWHTQILDNTIVTVPLRTTVVPALVLSTIHNLPTNLPYKIKQAIQKDHLPKDNHYHSFIKKIAAFSFVSPIHFYLRTRAFLYTKEKTSKIAPQLNKTKQPTHCPPAASLTNEQEHIVTQIQPYIYQPSFTPSLIHGVTGSGKTEIYKKLILKTIAQNKTVVLMLPEVSLSMQFETRFKKELSHDMRIFGFHSASKTSDKRKLWQCLLKKKPILIIGVHMPITLPIANLGLIIVDEEHEPGFQEKKHPKINSKELALWRAKHYNIPIVLGSATPSIQTLHNFTKNKWEIFHLTKRFSGTFPKIKKVLIKNTQKRSQFWITEELERAIQNRLVKKEQVIIYLNRRGYSFFAQCQQCGYTFTCPSCSVSLTVHKLDSHPPSNQLRCHYCDYSKAMPSQCSECRAGEKHLKRKGIGTQQVVNILQELFPSATIARADLDTTKKKRAWETTVAQFEAGNIDILVGTQTISKGYHFPQVTLVGILWADLNLHLPLFNANETVLQQLIQVAGRAGRGNNDSEVIIQTMHDHPIFEFMQEERYLQFYEKELSFRKAASYPPFSRLVHLELKHSDATILDYEAERLCTILQQYNIEKSFNISILGPTQPMVYRIQNTEIRHIFLKHHSFTTIHTLLQSISFDAFKSRIFVVPTG